MGITRFTPEGLSRLALGLEMTTVIEADLNALEARAALVDELVAALDDCLYELSDNMLASKPKQQAIAALARVKELGVTPANGKP
jgi:hypothetical protein